MIHIANSIVNEFTEITIIRMHRWPFISDNSAQNSE